MKLIKKYAIHKKNEYYKKTNYLSSLSKNLYNKAIPNCGSNAVNGIEGLVVSPVRLNIRSNSDVPYKRVSQHLKKQ